MYAKYKCLILLDFNLYKQEKRKAIFPGGGHFVKNCVLFTAADGYMCSLPMHRSSKGQPGHLLFLPGQPRGEKAPTCILLS
jgi:hypothetical protein